MVFITNLLASRKSACLLVVAALLAVGCEPPGQLNTIVPPIDTVSGMRIDEAELIEVKTILIDSVRTSSAPRVLSGFLEDPQIGNVGTRAGLEIYPAIPVGGLTIRDLAVFDSLYIDWSYDYVYGSNGSGITFDIFQLSDSLRAIDYFSFNQISYNNQSWGSFTINPTRNRSSGSQRYKLRFDSLGKRIMALSGKPELANNAAFIKEFKGFTFVPRPSSKGVIGFATVPNLLVRLHYHVQNVPVTVLMTAPAVLYRHFSSYQKSGVIPALAGLTQYRDTLPTAQSGGKAYIQSGLGLRALISIPNLRSLRQRLSGSAIVKAELLIKPLDIENLRPPRYLRLSIVDAQNRLLKTGKAEQIIKNFNSVAGVPVALASFFPYDTINKVYRMPLSTHVLSILQGAPNYKMVLSDGEIGGGLNRLIFNDFTQPDGIRLKVYYITQ